MTRAALDPLHAVVDADVRAIGLRPAASKRKLALSVVRGVLERRNLTADSLLQLAKAYGLEFYIGPPRQDDPGPLSPDLLDAIGRAAAGSPLSLDRLTRAVELAEAGLAERRKTLPPARKAQLVAAVYEVLTIAPDNEETARRIVRLAA